MIEKTVCLAFWTLLAVVNFPAEAKQQSRLPKVGILAAGSSASHSGRINALRESLRELGYIEGKTIRFDYRYALPTRADGAARSEFERAARYGTLRAPPTTTPPKLTEATLGFSSTRMDD